MINDGFARMAEEARRRLALIEDDLAAPGLVSQRSAFANKRKEHARARELMDLFEERELVVQQISEAHEIASSADEDEGIRELARNELVALQSRAVTLEDRAKRLLLPLDETQSRSVVLEIRAGTGGEEAALFAGELFRTYQRYGEVRGWKMSMVSSHPTGAGGFKEIIATLEGESVFGQLRFESGVHRVQRVPVTESSGRIHTSAVTVAVLPQAEDVEVAIKDEEIRIDRFRSTGPGGQSVNTTDSAIRITHLPTGEVVSCQDEKSQHKNLAKALKVLRSRLLQVEKERQHEERAQHRRQLIRSGDRSEKVRTYNFPQNRVTDHRISFTLYNLAEFMEGGIDEMIQRLTGAEEEKRLHELLEHSGSSET